MTLSAIVDWNRCTTGKIALPKSPFSFSIALPSLTDAVAAAPFIEAKSR